MNQTEETFIPPCRGCKTPGACKTTQWCYEACVKDEVDHIKRTIARLQPMAAANGFVIELIRRATPAEEAQLGALKADAQRRHQQRPLGRLLHEGVSRRPFEDRHNLGKQMRTLEDHKVNPENDLLTVSVLDEPGSGGANHAYEISGFDTATNPTARDTGHVSSTFILFQNGPINEVGVNGVTHEALIAILCDRLEGFQSGPYANDDNQVALLSLRQAQNALQRRTRERMARNVEGTHAV